MSKKGKNFISLEYSWWWNVFTLSALVALISLFFVRTFSSEVQIIEGSFPAVSRPVADHSSAVEHESLALLGDHIAQGVAVDSIVNWTIPVRLDSGVEQMTWALSGSPQLSQITWDGEVIGGVESFDESPDVAANGGRLIVTLPTELSGAGNHELQLSVVGQNGNGIMSGELAWGTKAEVLSRYRYLRFLFCAFEATFLVLAIALLLIPALGFESDEFLVWGWYLLTVGLVAPAYSGIWDLFTYSTDLQLRLQFVGMIIVPLSMVLQPAWMAGVHKRRHVVLPVLVLSLIGIIGGATFEPSSLIFLSDWVAVCGIFVLLTTAGWTVFLAIKDNNEAKFFSVIALLLGVGVFGGLLSARGHTSDYRVLLPCAALSAVASVIYLFVRHSGLANRYFSLVNSSGDGMIVVDRKGRIREANHAAKTLLGGQLGLFKDLLRESEYDTFLEHAFGETAARREEFHISGAKGEVIVESISVNLRGEATLLSLRDVRERMELELGLAQAARIETTELVVKVVSKDLGACVASIVSASKELESLCQRGAAKRRYDGFLRVLGRCSDLGAQLSMLVSGVDAEPRDFLVDNILAVRLDSLANGLGDKVHLHRLLGSGHVHVRGIIQEFESVFVNLIFNSCDALGVDGGNIWVESKISGDRVVISFEDDGPGIPEELWSQIWEPFFSTKDRGQGGGVGLSVVARVIRRHNGQYRVEHGQRSGGAKTVISFPIVSTDT